MATLDYVIMSEFARIDPSGLVTIVGDSFDRVQAPERGVGQQLFVTLRALLEEAETSISFEVKVRPPTAQFEMGVRGQAARRPVASEEDVRQCLNEHVQRVQTTRQNQYKGDVGGRMLKVWIAPDRDTDLERFIVSVAWEDDCDDS